MGDNRLGKLLRKIEGVVYWAGVAPALARLPAALGYRIASWRGDVFFWCQAGKRAMVACNLQQVLGNELSPAEVRQATRDWFRLASCEAVDVKRLRHKAQPLQRLIEIRGREHLEAALAAGNGAILCSGHFGSYNSGFSVLNASGFPITTIGRWGHNYNFGVYETSISSAERWFRERVYARPLLRHRQRPNIEPWPGRLEVAALAATALRANEVVTISIDAQPLDTDRARAVDVSFLGRQARLLPGVVAIAQVTGAPVLMGFLYRSADFSHQVWEISAPVPLEGDTASAFGRCAAEVSAAIRKSPAHWDFWADPAALFGLGLIRPERGTSSVAEPALRPARRFLHQMAAASVHARH